MVINIGDSNLKHIITMVILILQTENERQFPDILVWDNFSSII